MFSFCVYFRLHFRICWFQRIFVTSSLTVPGPPKSLDVSVIGSTHFMMQWVEPDDPNGVIVGYHMSYQSSEWKKPQYSCLQFAFTCLSMHAVRPLNVACFAKSCWFVTIPWLTWKSSTVFVGCRLSCTYFCISVDNLNLGRLQYWGFTADANATMARLTGLNPNTTYRVYLAAATAVGTGENIFIDATTALSGRK